MRVSQGDGVGDKAISFVAVILQAQTLSGLVNARVLSGVPISVGKWPEGLD